MEENYYFDFDHCVFVSGKEVMSSMKLQLSLIIKQKEKHCNVCLVSLGHGIRFLSKIHNVACNICNNNSLLLDLRVESYPNYL